jgi:hypothetical protein
MSEWVTIENGIVTALRGVTAGGRPMLAVVKGQTWRERKSLVSAISRERMPAAYVIVAGREESDTSYRRAGEPDFTVLVASRSERDADEARRGSSDVAGVLPLAEAVAARLQGLDLGEQRRLFLVDERPVSGEEGTALWEQRYEVRRLAGKYPCMFGGSPLVGASSVVRMEIGSLNRAVSHFAFPGVDGVFERFAGTRERSIVWKGQLRAAGESALDAIEQEIEALVQRGAVDNVSDATGRMFDACVASGFKRRGMRSIDHLTGEALQDFELEFVQLIA